MRLPGFAKARSLSRVIGWCLCLVLLALINVGAAQSMWPGDVSAQSAAGGSPPAIQVFQADPTILETADSAATYGFVVRRAAKVQVIEAGSIIRDIDNPTLATLKGSIKGLPAGAIPTDGSGKFITRLIASNDDGSDQRELMLSLGADLVPEGETAGASDNQTKLRSPQWLDQLSTPVSAGPSTATRNQPNFFTCPKDCAYCLKASEAAGLGFTQRCSSQRCYYSPDDRQSWYCYSEPQGWCCANQQVSQTTKSECARLKGYWSTNQYEAQDACQPRGYCCINGQIYYPVTESDCRLKGGSYWSTSQAQTAAYCRQQQTCWCCAKGQVFETTQDRCITAGGACYSSQSQAAAACYQTQPPIRYPDIK